MALSFLPVVFRNLNSLIQKEVGLLLGVDKEMKKLSSMLSTIQAVLEDAEQKQLQDKAIQDWLRKLKDATYEVDDILDECATEALRWESEGQSFGSLKKVSNSLLNCNPVDNVLFRHKIGIRMKEITETLDAIAEERRNFHLCFVVVEKLADLAGKRDTSSVLTQPQLYGRDEDKEKIVKILVEHVHDCKDVSVYPIIGMGGLGKTTLAQMVFHDERMRSHFEPRIWVYVSEDFDVERVIKAIIESARGLVSEPSNLESLQKDLRDMLNGKRYLIVLDDVWNEDQEKWDRLRYTLACGSKGASIITTTRLEMVASIVGTLPSHWLSFLSEDDCWLLFRQRAFGRENEEQPNLVAIGKEIVKKCGGVPLAAKALGGLLRFKREDKEWLFIKESEIWNLPQDKNSILPVLRLSYYNLPLELRRCFAYCAVFPKGFAIKKEKLVHLWMANDFISSSRSLEVEDIGNGIWNELYWRSFFQDVDKDEFGNITFTMHDLMHDLAQSIMEDECHIMEAGSSCKIPKQRIRHVTLVADRSGVFPKALHKVESLRSILQQYRVTSSYNSRKFSCKFTKFDSLRVFDAMGTGMKQLSSSIGNSKHLRYLNLSHTLIRTLPKSICSLSNLQTLNLNDCCKLQRLPKNMKYLRNLRHLFLERCDLIQSMPPKLGQLTLLKTLSFFIAGNSTGRRLVELQRLDLGGKLRIEHLGRVINSMEAKKANLIRKQNLRILELSWGCERESKSQENVEEILEALEPHPNVEELLIENYKGAHFPLWMGDSTKNIVTIVLRDCNNCSLLPAFGQLPSLRRLEIFGMDNMEYIDNEFPGGRPLGGFPSLEVLHIYELPNLKGLSKEEGRELLPRLREITIVGCPKVPPTNLASLLSLKSLCIKSCDELESLLDHGLRGLESLRDLKIHHCNSFSSFSESLGHLSALEKLEVRGCPKLVALPESIRHLNSLRDLQIHHCNSFSSFSESLGHLSALENLEVRGCPKLVALPESIRHLNSLRRLIIRGNSRDSHGLAICADLKTLPEALQHVPALLSLKISHYPELTSLPEWLGNLTSLQSLSITDCPKIPSLPHSIRSLTNLRTVEFWGLAPGFASRCKEDFFKIAQLPHFLVHEHHISI